MPMTWDAAADAKLFAAVMAVYDVKATGAQNEQVAAMMGDGCTPKAITHRLSKIKAAASASTPSPKSSSKVTVASARKANAAKLDGTPTKPAKGAKGGKKGGTRPTLMTDNGSDDEEDFTPVKKRKIGTKVEEDDESVGKIEEEGGEIKKIKVEVVEEGEGEVV